jgi:hypothetical protein
MPKAHSAVCSSEVDGLRAFCGRHNVVDDLSCLRLSDVIDRR